MQTTGPKVKSKKQFMFKCQDSNREDKDEEQKFNIVQKRACSCLFDLSDYPQEGYNSNPQKVSKTVAKNNNIYSPWKNKVKDEILQIKRTNKNKRQRLSELQQIKKVNYFNRRKTSHSKKLHQQLRHHTQPRQAILSMPKLLKTETIVLQNDNKTNEESYLSQNKTYSSHHVLHITRKIIESPSKINNKCNNSHFSSQKKNKMAMISNCSNLEWQLNLNKQNRNTKYNRLGQTLNNRVRNIKCAKKKRFKKMFTDTITNSVNSNHFNNTRPFINPKQYLSSKTNKFDQTVPSNPISRTLLQKYLQVCDDISRQIIK